MKSASKRLRSTIMKKGEPPDSGSGTVLPVRENYRWHLPHQKQTPEPLLENVACLRHHLGRARRSLLFRQGRHPPAGRPEKRSVPDDLGRHALPGVPQRFAERKKSDRYLYQLYGREQNRFKGLPACAFCFYVSIPLFCLFFLEKQKRFCLSSPLYPK